MTASPSSQPDPQLEAAVQRSLDAVLRALALEPLGDDRFRAVSEPGRIDRLFGGQTLAQALVAASDTVDGKDPHSLHAYFVQAGVPGEPVELAVDRVRDGRSMATRQISVLQGSRTLLTVIASFHANPSGPEQADPPPPSPPPGELPLLQDWLRDPTPEVAPMAQVWVDDPPPLEIRTSEPPNFLGGPNADGTRSHWMRLPRDVGDSPLLHTALLTYASDFFLLDMIFRSYPTRVVPMTYTGISLDHSMWFHGPVRFDGWHQLTHQTVAISGDRGLVRAAIHDASGRLVASAMQEALVRPLR